MQKTFKMNTLGDYLDLYVQSDALLLEDLFKKFRNKCIEIYELDPAYSICTWISMATIFKKKNRNKIRIIN